MNIGNSRKPGHLTISICIATHERARLLASTLEAIGQQLRLPDEIVISDSSITQQSEQVISQFQLANPQLLLQYVKSESRALPWHRWHGFRHSSGDIIFFMDDDILLPPTALQMLEGAYQELFARYTAENIAGVGFCTTFEDGSEKVRRPASFEERWLGTVYERSGSITAGGLGIPPRGLPKGGLVEVGRLVGGRMTFRREILMQVGLLDQLVDLYNRGLGRAEDTVLSYLANKYGKLFMMSDPPVIHPCDSQATKTAFATDGLKKGLAETWGRAHTMLWMAGDLAKYRKEWIRVGTLEIVRAMWWGIIRKPWAISSWGRFCGAMYGFLLGLFCWKRIPPSARRGLN